MTKKRTKRSASRSRSKTYSKPAAPSLRFSPTAWAKLLFLRDYGPTEVGGFGISAADDLLLVEDIALVEQTCSWGHVAFDDVSVADFYDRQVDAGRQPAQFSRLWLHTHPGDCARPSGVDEQTFSRVFGSADWAVMAILAKGGQSFARLRFNVGPGGDIEIPVGVDYGRPFACSDEAVWEAEYLANVHPEMLGGRLPRSAKPVLDVPLPDEFRSDLDADWEDWSYDTELAAEEV